LAALPPLTLTFNSKDLIVRQVFLSPTGGPLLWALALAGALLTARYTFRLIFVVFYGPAGPLPIRRAGGLMLVPLMALAIGAGLAGAADLAAELFGAEGFFRFLHQVLPPAPTAAGRSDHGATQWLSLALSLAGGAGTYWLYVRRPDLPRRAAAGTAAAALHRFLLGGLGFDWLYDRLLVRPYCWLARVNARDAVDWLVERPARLSEALHGVLAAAQTGQVRWYAVGVAVGAIVLTALMVWL